MFETWIVGLLAALLATPIGIASFVSAWRSKGGAEPVHTTSPAPLKLRRHEADLVAHPAAHRHHYRHVAA